MQDSISNTQWLKHEEISAQTQAFKVLRIGYALIWIFNLIYQCNPAWITHKFYASFTWQKGQPQWYARYIDHARSFVQWAGPSHVAIATIVIGSIITLSLLTGWYLRAFTLLGFFYSLGLWTTTGHLGGPYVAGATDPGTLIVYSLVFLVIFLIEPHQRRAINQESLAHIESSLEWRYALVRIVFGLLWAFDAGWKWTPYFLHHAVSYLNVSEAGQPAWIVTYIQFVVHIINAIGPIIFGYIAAISETVIAIGLLFNLGLRYILPFGFLYSLVLWTTAEGFGGPYTNVTGVGGDVLGTTIIYCVLFLYLMLMYPPHRAIYRFFKRSA